jgi:hypothetical protein
MTGGGKSSEEKLVAPGAGAGMPVNGAPVGTKLGGALAGIGEFVGGYSTGSAPVTGIS